MIKKLVVWTLFLAACFGIYKAASAFKNPWSMPVAVPISAALPTLPPGCKEKC